MNGHLDGLTGAYIVGWAEDGPGTCVITVKQPDGSLVATGMASWDRPDLASLRLGRTNLAFRIPLPLMPERIRLHVFANDIELLNSPIDVGSGFYDGFMTVLGGSVEGWVTERSAESAAPMITILNQDGQIVGRTQSSKRQDNPDPLFNPAGFFTQLDQCCFGRGELKLTAFASGVAFATGLCDLKLQGNLEQLTSDSCSGWLFSPNEPSRRLEIEIFRNGVSEGVVKCRTPRTDVTTLFASSTNQGFSKTLCNLPHTELEFTALSLRLLGSNVELFDGPFLLGGRAALAGAARKVTRLALDDAVGLTAGEKAALQGAMADFLTKTRSAELQVFRKQAATASLLPQTIRLNVVIPVYRGVEITRACIESVLATRSPERDKVIVLNDCGPEAGMAPMLLTYSGVANMHVLTNETNVGFVKTVNRGLSFCQSGDVILLNSDTEMFPGGLNELWRVAHAAADIATVTAMSNNATIFSYPHVSLRTKALDDLSWAALAALALARNAGLALDVPTGHGFCMLIRREVLRRVGMLDEGFGRGYGEENDFCNRAADLGYRNVVAGGALVLHHESISFMGETAGLLAVNLSTLERRYPEYTQTIMEAERRDDLRACRWALDTARLERTRQTGTRFALIVRHSIGGGTARAIADIEMAVGYDGAEKLDLACRTDGFMELKGKNPSFLAVFAPDEVDVLMRMLSAADVSLVVVHQVLGYPAEFLPALARFIKGRQSVFYAHDFYSLCPRVTLINAAGKFCGLAETDVCARCVAVGGSHESSRLTALAPSAHRAMFADLLAQFTHVVTPSEDAAGYLRRGFHGLEVEAIPHPLPEPPAYAAVRQIGDAEVVLFGALGPHKGSGKLLEIARLAILEYPALRMRVIGYTDIDDALLDVGNVTITGPYKPKDLPSITSTCKGSLALFLSEWPETFSYTLSEALQYGFLPIVPDIGALAERVRLGNLGIIIRFPSTPSEVLDLLRRTIEDQQHPFLRSGTPPVAAYADHRNSTRRVFAIEDSDNIVNEMMMRKHVTSHLIIKGDGFGQLL